MATTMSGERALAASTPAADARGLAALCLAALLGATNTALLGALLPALAVDLATGVPLLGQIATLMALLAVPLALVVGPLADQYGQRRLLIAAGVVMVASAAASALAAGYLPLLAARLLSAPGAAIVGGVPLAMASSLYAGEARRRAMSWTVAALSGGAIVGVPLLAAVAAAIGWRAAFVALGLAWLGLIGLLLRWLPALPGAGGRLSPRALLGAYAPLLRGGDATALLGATGLRAVGWLGAMIYLGAFAAERYGLDTTGVGLVYVVGGVGYVAGSLVAGGPLGRAPARPLGAATTVALALGTAVLFLLPLAAPAALALLLATAVAGAVSWVCLTTLLAAETPAGQATTMVLNGACLGLGTALGGGLGGLLLAAGGYPALGLGLPLVTLASAFLFRAPRPEPPRAAAAA